MSVRTVNFDALAACVPINKSAAMARDSRGEQYQPNLKMPPGYIHSELPLPVRAITPMESTSSGFVNLTGRAIGRLQVKGVYALDSATKSDWVVRCVCGRFETRKAKFIKTWTPGQGGAECISCKHLEDLKRGAKLISTGKAKPCDWVERERRINAMFNRVKVDLIRAALAFDDGEGTLDQLSVACRTYRELVEKRRIETGFAA